MYRAIEQRNYRNIWQIVKVFFPSNVSANTLISDIEHLIEKKYLDKYTIVGKKRDEYTLVKEGEPIPKFTAPKKPGGKKATV